MFQDSDIEISIVERFAKIAKLHSVRTAIKYGVKELSYQELNQTSDRLARSIRELVAGEGEAVVLLFTHGITVHVAQLAVLKARNFYSCLDGRQSTDRLVFLIKKLGAKLLLCDKASAVVATTLGAQLRGLQVCNVEKSLEMGAGTDDAVTEIERPKIDPHSIATVVYTSGTTGEPQGVVLTHRNILHLVRNHTNYLGLNMNDRASIICPLHSGASLMEVFPPILNGASIYPFALHSAKRMEFVDYLRGERITTYTSVPAVFRMLLEGLPGKLVFPDMRMIRLSGDRCLSIDLDYYKKHFSDQCILRISLGSAEMLGFAQYFIHKSTPLDSGILPVGYPLKDILLSVVDEHGIPVRNGEVGEIVVKSKYLAAGYWNDPMSTQERFKFDPSTGCREFYTRDLGYLDERGALHHVGRSDSRIKINGKFVLLESIESELMRLPEVQEAAVIPVSDGGAADHELHAFVVPTKKISVRTLKQTVAENRAQSEHPLREIHLLKSMPLTASRKVDRKKLEGVALTKARSAGRRRSTPGRAISRSEELLRETWVELLGCDDVGPNDNFFSVGGQSLLATQLVDKIKDKFNVDISLHTIFAFPELHVQARIIDEKRKNSEEKAGEIRPLPRANTSYLLSGGQRGLWFLNHFGGASSAYNIPFAVILKGSLNIDALERSFRTLISRHEILRVRFIEEGGKPLQIIEPRREFFIDMENCAVDELQDKCNFEMNRPFDLSCEPPFRVKLYKCSRDTHALVITVHHIICDGASLEIFIRELSAAYNDHNEVREPSFLPLEMQYLDYVLREERALDDGSLNMHLEYWRLKLSKLHCMLQIQPDFPRPKLQTFRGSAEKLTFSPQVLEKVEELSRRVGVTTFMFFLAVFFLLLHRYSRSKDIAIGLPVASRLSADTRGLIGLFNNTVIIRCHLTDRTFFEFLHSIKQICLEAYAHQIFPFHKLADYLPSPAAAGYPSRVPIMFSYQDAVVEKLQLDGLHIQRIEHQPDAAKFDLTLMLLKGMGKSLTTELVYNSDLYARHTIKKMLVRYEDLVRQVLDDVDMEIQAHDTTPMSFGQFNSVPKRIREL